MATGYTDQELRDFGKEVEEGTKPLVCKITCKYSDHDTVMYLLFCPDKPELDWVFSPRNPLVVRTSIELIKPDTLDKWENRIMDEAIRNTFVLGNFPDGYGGDYNPHFDCLTQHVRPKQNYPRIRNK